MSAEVDRSKLTMPLKVNVPLNQEDLYGNNKNERFQTNSRHYSFSQEEKNCYHKRRYSEKYTPGSAVHGFRRKYARFANRASQGKIVLPTKFLLGGNIRDPLNLNSLCNEEINRSLNEFTPVSSPLPIPGHRLENKVPIIYPVNIHDPLNLEDSNENAKILTVSPQKTSRPRKRRHSHKKPIKVVEKSESREEVGTENKLMKPLSIEIEPIGADVFTCPPSREGKTPADFSAKKIVDKIVSPVIPQISPKWKRRRTNSECRPDIGDVPPLIIQPPEKERPAKSEKAAVVRSKSKRNSTTLSGFKGKNSRYIHGNYSSYSGYRAPVVEDNRLRMFSRDMLTGKDVLDIGCNNGHFTIGVAKKFAPKKITGIDIDGKLVEAAKRNVRHHLSVEVDAGFPVSLKIMRGPLAAHPLLGVRVASEGGRNESGRFPHNVTFEKANYFLETDEEMRCQQPKYDVILALGITKWIHLNYGDAGLKRCFHRMFRQLRPGGNLVLEAQKWGSYRKKKKLSEHTFQIYKSLQFRPDQFREYLTSDEIGFSSCRFLDIPSNKSKGSCSTVHIFTKDDVNSRLNCRPQSSLIPANVDRGFGYPEMLEPRHTWVDSAESRSSLGWFEDSSKLEVESSLLTPCSTCANSPSDTNASQSDTPRTERTCSSAEYLTMKDATPSFFDSQNYVSDGTDTSKESDDVVETPWCRNANDLPERNGL